MRKGQTKGGPLPNKPRVPPLLPPPDVDDATAGCCVTPVIVRPLPPLVPCRLVVRAAVSARVVPAWVLTANADAVGAMATTVTSDVASSRRRRREDSVYVAATEDTPELCSWAKKKSAIVRSCSGVSEPLELSTEMPKITYSEPVGGSRYTVPGRWGWEGMRRREGGGAKEN